MLEWVFQCKYTSIAQNNLCAPVSTPILDAPPLLKESVVNASKQFIEWSGLLAKVFNELTIVITEAKETVEFCDIPRLWPVSHFYRDLFLFPVSI